MHSSLAALNIKLPQGNEGSTCLLLDGVPDSTTVGDIKRYVNQQQQQLPGKGEAVSLQLMLTFGDKSTADWFFKQRHNIGGGDVKISECHPHTAQEFIQEDFDQVLIVRGIDGIEDIELKLHLVQVQNGGDGVLFPLHRISSDCAVMQFKSSKVVDDILKHNHCIDYSKGKKSVTIQRPYNKVQLATSSSADSDYCLDPSVIQSLRERFPVTISETEQGVRVTAALPDIIQVQQFLKSKKPGAFITSPERPVERKELNNLGAKIVFHVMRLQEGSPMSKHVDLKWTNNNKSVTVFIDEKYEQEFIVLYETVKIYVKKANRSIAGVCEHRVKRFVDSSHARIKDISILPRGDNLVFLGTQEALDRDLESLVSELRSGTCDHSCPCGGVNIGLKH